MISKDNGWKKPAGHVNISWGRDSNYQAHAQALSFLDISLINFYFQFYSLKVQLVFFGAMIGWTKVLYEKLAWYFPNFQNFY